MIFADQPYRDRQGGEPAVEAKRALQEIWMADTKEDALAAFDVLVETWGVKYEKAVQGLVKDRDALMTF